MKKENRPDNEEGSDSRKNICRFTIRGEAKPETAFDFDSTITIIEVMVPFCPVCRTYGDFYILSDTRRPIPEDYLDQECGCCGISMIPIVIGFLYLRTLTKGDITGKPEIASLQLGLDFGSIRKN